MMSSRSWIVRMTLVFMITSGHEVKADPGDRFKMDWSYLTQLPPNADRTTHNYKFAETQPWNGIVCPKGSTIYQIRYNHIVPRQYFGKLPSQNLLPWQQKLKDEAKLLERYSKGRHRITENQEKNVKKLTEKLKLQIKELDETERDYANNPGPNNLMTLWPHIQEFQQNRTEINIHLTYLNTFWQKSKLRMLIHLSEDAVLTYKDNSKLNSCVKTDGSSLVSAASCDLEADDKDEKYKYTEDANVSDEDYEALDRLSSGNESCGTLAYCLGYQACLLRFSNDFCFKDPAPGIRKLMNLTVTCTKDEILETEIKRSKVPQDSSDKINSQKDEVIFLKYKSVTEDGSKDYHTTQIKPLILKEEEVFHRKCPPLDEARQLGFSGNCSVTPDPENVARYLWTSLGRCPEKHCRDELFEVYCAYSYDPTGRCVPPFLTEKIEDGTIKYNFKSLPKVGKRYDLQAYWKIFDHLHMSLIPARFGFIIIAHARPAHVVELIKLIFREEHYYVVHIDFRQDDVRQDLSEMLSSEFPDVTNIRVLPKERSFVTSWGSYQIVRAELEGYEELLRMGVWDFSVVLSGTDLPLRDVDDLAATLAPHRGRNFLKIIVETDTKKTPNAMLWYSCGGHVYSVGGRTLNSENGPSHSAWVVLNREFTEELVSQDRASAVNQFYLQTSVVPDENYIGDVLSQSKHNNTLTMGGFHFLKEYEGKNINHLCRHSDDTDGCGKGPAFFTDRDISRLSLATNFHFFARKFTLEKDDRARNKMIKHLKSHTYEEVMSKFFPNKLLMSLGKYAIKKIFKPTRADLTFDSILQWRVVPAVVQRDPCCENIMKLHGQFGEPFKVWIDFRIGTKKRTFHTVRASLHSRLPVTCFPHGHIKAMHLTTRLDRSDVKKDKLPRGMRAGLPMPTSPAGGNMMWINLFADFRDTNQQCQNKSPSTKSTKGKTFAKFPLKNFKETPEEIKFRAILIDAKGVVREEDRITLELSNNSFPGSANFTMYPCAIRYKDKLTPGKWTVKLVQVGVDDPYVYTQSVYLTNEDDPEQYQRQVKKLLPKLWDVEDAMFLSDDDFREYYTDPDEK